MIKRKILLVLTMAFLLVCQQKPEKKAVIARKIDPIIKLNLASNDSTKINQVVLAYNDTYGNAIQYDFSTKEKSNIISKLNLQYRFFKRISFLIRPTI